MSAGRLAWASLERRLDATLLGSLGIDSEASNLSNSRSGTNPAGTLADCVTSAPTFFFSLYLRFEIGM